MAMDLVLKALSATGSLVGLKVSKKGDLFTQKRIPDYASAVLAGKVIEALDTTTTVALVARPTTLASLTLQNPASSGKIYVVYGLLAYTDVVAATLGTVTVWHCAHKLAIAALTRELVLVGTGAGTGNVLKAGVSSYGGQAIIARGETVVDDGWTPTPLTVVSNIATTNFQSNAAGLIVPVVIPPSFHYSLQTTATVVTFETALGFIWGEFDEDELTEA